MERAGPHRPGKDVGVVHGREADLLVRPVLGHLLRQLLVLLPHAIRRHAAPVCGSLSLPLVRGKRSQREREEEEEAADGFSGGTMQRWPLTPEASSVLVLQGVRKQQLNLDRLDHRRLLTTMDKKWQKPTYG
jgi:hypothetical protein